jgi:putative transposase
MRFPSYGTRQMTAHLNRVGYHVNRKRISRLMRLMGIQSIYPRPRRAGIREHSFRYPYLLKNVQIGPQNHVWGSDITYIPLSTGYLYLTAVLDLYSRFVLSWELSNSLESDFCIRTLESALRYGQPTIMNTDQGVQYTSNNWISRLTANNIQISMAGKGRCFDNILVERFWRSLKWEEVHLKHYQNSEEALEGISEYIESYNKERPHSSLGYQTPWEVYSGGAAPRPPGQKSAAECLFKKLD